MMNRIGYILLYGWVKAHALLPMRALYLLSDILYFVVRHVARYRVRIVRRNLQASFPEKSPAELRELERAFYHHFADYIVETIKLAHISLEELQARANLRNPELVDQLMDRGHSCILLLMGHYGNWEWFTATPSCFADARVCPIYRPLTNKAFDRLFIELRSHFGAVGIKKNDTFRDMVKLKREKTRSVIVFLADQTPSKANLHYWTDFLHQDTPILTGPERIARKLDIPVIYVDIQKQSRGYYTVDFELLTEHPKELPDMAITERYARRLEQNILRQPAYWLWTHNRWKHKHEPQA